MAIAPEYFRHMARRHLAPAGAGTCLAKILGVFTITVKQALPGEGMGEGEEGREGGEGVFTITVKQALPGERRPRLPCLLFSLCWGTSVRFGGPASGCRAPQAGRGVQAQRRETLGPASMRRGRGR